MTVSRDESSYKRIAEMLDALPERVIRYRLSDHVIRYCNTAWAAGHNHTPTDVIGLTLDELLSEPERADLGSKLAGLGPDNPLVADDVPRPARDAPGQWVEWVDRYLPGVDGAEVLTVGRDVTARHIAETNLADSEARFRELADMSADVVWRFVLEPHPHLDYVSPSVENILGYPPSVFLGNPTLLLDILDDEGRAIVSRVLQGGPMPDRCDLRFRCADGSMVIGETQTTSVPGGIQGVSRDVTELRELQESMAALALRDPLTGLANRRLLDELLEASLARTQRSGTPIAVAFVGLDGFRTVNDTYGHDAGDAVLCETAKRLQSLVRAVDVVARFGGDEFVIVYELNYPSTDNLIPRIERVLSAPIEVNATTAVRCPATIGQADTRTVGRDAAALLAAAGTAVYDLKMARDHARYT